MQRWPADRSSPREKVLEYVVTCEYLTARTLNGVATMSWKWTPRHSQLAVTTQYELHFSLPPLPPSSSSPSLLLPPPPASSSSLSHILPVPTNPNKPVGATCGLPCDDRCVQEGITFHCECNPGRVLQSDGISCRGNSHKQIVLPEQLTN